jgi:hypothetical protein
LAAHCWLIIASVIDTVAGELMLRKYSGYPGSLLPKTPAAWYCA